MRCNTWIDQNILLEFYEVIMLQQHRKRVVSCQNWTLHHPCLVLCVCCLCVCVWGTFWICNVPSSNKSISVIDGPKCQLHKHDDLWKEPNSGFTQQSTNLVCITTKWRVKESDFRFTTCIGLTTACTYRAQGAHSHAVPADTTNSRLKTML